MSSVAKAGDAKALEGILSRGAYTILRDEAGLRESWEAIHETVIESIGEVAGPEAQKRVDRDGLGCLHDVMPAADIGALRDQVMPRVRGTLLTATCRVAREVLGIESEFFVDDYTILRVNYPYEVALKAPKSAENPGIGRMSEAAREDHARSKVIDPVYNPRGYHRDQPPAAWAHGPHLDTWTGHSHDGVNLWWAIGDVVDENSMFVYPELFGVPLEPDPRSLYLREGRPLPRPTPIPLRAGEMLVFNPEVLHGTHLNVSGLTRVAASTRINARAPKFDPGCFYAREFWHSSSNLERGRFEDVIRFARDENLGDPEPPQDSPPAPVSPCVALRSTPSRDQWIDVCSASDLPERGKLVVASSDGEPRFILIDTASGARAVGARCPHLGTCLSDGFHDDQFIHCPAHAMKFDLATGRSSSEILRLAVADVREIDGRLQLRLV